MRDKNLAVSENICNFVLGKSSIFVSMIFVSVFDVCVAQNRVNGTFNTVGYVANNPKVYVLPEDSISTDGDEDVEATKEQSLDSIPTNVIKSRISNVSFPLKDIWITSPFGIRKDPMNRKRRRMHNGLDLRAKYEPVYAMMPGVITAVSFSKNGGYYVTVNHGICVCSYLHLSKILVRRGQRVQAGQMVAISGNSGKRTTGPHLHITCRWGNEKGKFFNPVVLLNFVADELLNNLKS